MAEPVISSLDPSNAGPEGGTIVTIGGENFIDVEGVSFGDELASFGVDSEFQISAEVPPVAFEGDVSLVVTTAEGSASTTFTYISAGVTVCTVSAFNVPTARSGCTQVGTKVGERFRMEADFASPDCNCCEYRQFVRGRFMVNGRVVRHLLPDPAGGAPRPMLPRPSPGSADDNFREDGVASPSPGINAFYGHRSEGNTDPNDRYLPDRAAGCQYRGSDFPGVSASTGSTYSIDLDFRGQIIDMCVVGTVRNSTEWTVACSGVI